MILPPLSSLKPGFIALSKTAPTHLPKPKTGSFIRINILPSRFASEWRRSRSAPFLL
jgi:hypothetical protein